MQLIKKYKRKFTLVIFSIFIVWHVLAITIGSSLGKNVISNNLVEAYGYYLTILHRYSTWHFYSPNPGLGSILSYDAISHSGESERYPLTQARRKLNHTYFRYTNFYYYLFHYPDSAAERGYDKSVAKYLCGLHKDKDISEIKFSLRYQKPFSHLDYQNGKRALDEEFLGDEKVFGPFSCV